MALPPIFGTTWEGFLANWCLGNPPVQDRETVENALRALLRIWPEREAAIVGRNTRGLVLISPAIESGIVLSACENLIGFENVLRRLKTGERSAYTELVFAARLVKAGFQPILEPSLGSGFLDTRIPMDAGDVYCEVIAPETSETILEVKTAASDLAATLMEQNTGRRVEVLLSVDIDESISSRVVEAVNLLPDSNETWPLETIALISSEFPGMTATSGLRFLAPKQLQSSALLNVHLTVEFERRESCAYVSPMLAPRGSYMVSLTISRANR
jgi:hypothetical protein